MATEYRAPAGTGPGVPTAGKGQGTRQASREACPGCARTDGHGFYCVMFGMTDERSSLIYGYPVCQCCGLRFSDERTELHEQRGGLSLIERVR